MLIGSAIAAIRCSSGFLGNTRVHCRRVGMYSRQPETHVCAISVVRPQGAHNLVQKALRHFRDQRSKSSRRRRELARPLESRQRTVNLTLVLSTLLTHLDLRFIEVSRSERLCPHPRNPAHAEMVPPPQPVPAAEEELVDYVSGAGWKRHQASALANSPARLYCCPRRVFGSDHDARRPRAARPAALAPRLLPPAAGLLTPSRP